MKKPVVKELVSMIPADQYVAVYAVPCAPDGFFTRRLGAFVLVAEGQDRWIEPFDYDNDIHALESCSDSSNLIDVVHVAELDERRDYLAKAAAELNRSRVPSRPSHDSSAGLTSPVSSAETISS